MANNKVALSDGTVLLDLTADTVTADAVIAGRSLHLANGDAVTGTLEFPVTSVNSKTGAVSLTADDVGALSTSAGTVGTANLADGAVTQAKMSGLLLNNAGAHNSVYRGLYLGASVSDAQWNAIAAGTFDDMYIGDHWYINGILWRIAAFDYYYQTGDDGGICTTHHVTIVPDVCLDSQQMNAKNVVTGGYVGSAMYTANLENSKTIIANAFGSSHILSHRNLLNNLVSSGRQTGVAWCDSTVELMTEQNVFGTSYFSIPSTTSTTSFLLRVDKSQFPLFTFQPWRIGGRQWYWLRDVATTTQFSLVDGQGISSYYIASGSAGVRPSFSICKENA